MFWPFMLKSTHHRILANEHANYAKDLLRIQEEAQHERERIERESREREEAATGKAKCLATQFQLFVEDVAGIRNALTARMADVPETLTWEENVPF
jgi:hypothetical protein